MRKIQNLIFHCSESLWGDVDIIREWHLARGWSDVGYNGVILNGKHKSGMDYNYNYDGIFQEGRSLDFSAYVEKDEKAAHALGYNKNSIGICLIGRNKFTVRQFQAAFYIAKIFERITPDIRIMGHYQCKGTTKTCPNFDMERFRTLLLSDESHGESIKKYMDQWIDE